MEEFKCGICDKSYKTNKGLEDHMKNKHPFDDSEEELVESDTIVSNEKDIVLDEKYEGLTEEEITWVKRFILGFRFNGRVSDRDYPMLEKLYLSKVKNPMTVNPSCSGCVITMASTITAKYM